LFIITEKKIWSSFQQWNNLIELILVFLTVPITVIASTKKIKSLVTNIHLLTQAIRHSSKLVSIGWNKQCIILILFKFSLSNNAMVCRFWVLMARRLNANIPLLKRRKRNYR
jgi:hypothetical protein